MPNDSQLPTEAQMKAESAHTAALLSERARLTEAQEKTLARASWNSEHKLVGSLAPRILAVLSTPHPDKSRLQSLATLLETDRQALAADVQTVFRNSKRARHTDPFITLFIDLTSPAHAGRSALSQAQARISRVMESGLNLYQGLSLSNRALAEQFMGEWRDELATVGISIARWRDARPPKQGGGGLSDRVECHITEPFLTHRRGLAL